MSSKNETPALIASLLITIGLLGGGYWLFTRNGGLNVESIPGLGNSPNASNPSTTSAPTTAPTPAPAPTSTTPNTADNVATQFAEVAAVPAGLFNYGGSTTWAPIRGTIDTVIQQAHPSFQLRYTDPIGAPPGSGTGIEMLLSNQLSFSQSSRSLKPEERAQAQQQGFSLQEIPVALEGLAIAVNPDLPVDGLTLEQVRDIYLGNVNNWSQVGGPNLPIVPVSRPLEGGTVEFFVSTVLGGADLPASTRILNSTTEALRFISNTPGSIYYASAPEVVGQCTVKPIAVGRTANQLVKPYLDPYVPPINCPAQRNQINSPALRSGEYPLTRRLFVIVREDGQTDQQAGEAYANLLLTKQGQDLLSQSGFIPIR